MKVYFTVFLALLILAGGIFSEGCAAETTKPAQRAELLDDATMRKLVAADVPSDRYDLLSLIGDWDFDLKYWSRKDADWEFSTGTATNEMILGGRYLSSTLRTTLNIGGNTIPYEGRSFSATTRAGNHIPRS